jgi:hypothetical protein
MGNNAPAKPCIFLSLFILGDYNELATPGHSVFVF